MEKLSIQQRLFRILIYNDTGFYELMVGLTAVMFGLAFWSTSLTHPEDLTVSLITNYLDRAIWSLVFVSLGITQVIGSISKASLVRIAGNFLGMTLWAFWALSSFSQRGIAWPVFGFITLKLAWVTFRVLIDRSRVGKGDII